jgi:hypothetical protein
MGRFFTCLPPCLRSSVTSAWAKCSAELKRSGGSRERALMIAPSKASGIDS